MIQRINIFLFIFPNTVSARGCSKIQGDSVLWLNVRMLLIEFGAEDANIQLFFVPLFEGYYIS
jgi:hypothetical protein